MVYYPKITVVTPNYNQGTFLERTICSVLNQGYPNLEYIIMDGGSTDNSLEIIKKYESQLTFWESKKDKGMYDAINRAFNISTGEIMCWINSDDILWKNSLSYVASTFVSNPKIQWIQGFPSVIDEFDSIILQREPVFSIFFFFLNKHESRFSFIQQESTFWSKQLWEKSGSKFNLNYTLAADFDLWLRFFRYEKLYCTSQQLGAFRKRANQKSSNMKLYLHEANDSVIANKSNLSLADRLILMFLKTCSKIDFFKKIIDKKLTKPRYINVWH